MFHRLIIISILIFNSLACGQTNLDTLKCNTNILAEFQNHIDSLNDELAVNFLHTFSDTCSNNAEYSEWSNELLFQFLERYPETFINILSNFDNIDTSYIYHNLESPVNDGINLVLIRNKIKSVNSNSKIKANILKFINSAINKK